MERLQKVIAASGITSRRKAEKLIVDGKVKVNGEIITELGYKVKEKDEIKVNDILLAKETKVYYLLNKPREVISSSYDDKNRKTVVDLINTNQRIYPIGRLDYDTTGLILLTNDGEFANLMMHPSNEIDKVYVAKIEGILTSEEQRLLRSGVIIENRKTDKAKIKVRSYNKKTNSSIIEVVIHEGKYHEVKKMFEAVHHNVLKLKREKFAFLTLDGLNSGDYRKLTIKEVKRLYALANEKND